MTNDYEAKAEKVWLEHRYMTPEDAERLLERNTHNRPPKRRKIEQMAAAMKAGEWTVVPDCIALDVDGVIVNGQNRLMAQIRAGISLTWLILHDLPKDAYAESDQGVKRSFSDTLAVQGQTQHGQVASLVNSLFIYSVKGRLKEGGADTQPRPRQLQAIFDREGPDRLLEAIRLGGRLQHATRMGRLAANFVAWRTTAADVDAEPGDALYFAECLIDPKPGEQEAQPATLLRDMFLKDAAKPKHRQALTSTPPMAAALYLKAFRAFQLGEEVGTLRWRQGGARPEPWPEPLVKEGGDE